MRASTAMILGAVGAAGLAAAATPTRAQHLDDKFWVQGAAYWADIDSSASVDSIGNTDLGTVIDFESDLEMDDSQTLPSFSAGWRAWGRFIVGGDYYALDRDGEATLSRDIVFDDVTFPVSANVSSSMSSNIYRLTLGYSFIRNDTWEVGAALGLHMTDFELSLEGEATAGGVSVGTSRRGRDFLAPLPTLGAYANWQVTPKIAVNGRVDYMSLEIDDYDGGLTNAQISASYRFTRNFGAGIMYRFVDYNVDVTKDDWTGSLDYEFNGPVLYAELAF